MVYTMKNIRIQLIENSITFSKFAYLSNIVLSGEALCWCGSRTGESMPSGSIEIEGTD